MGFVKGYEGVGIGKVEEGNWYLLGKINLCVIFRED